MLALAPILLLLAASDLDRLVGQSESAFFNREFVSAERYARQAVAASPHSASARLQLARSLIELGRLPDALEQIQLVSAAAHDANTRFVVGQVMQRLSDDRLQELERVAPDSPELLELLGRQHERRGDLKQALSEYRRAAQLQSHRAGVHFLIGNALWKLREFDAALTDLLLEINTNPGHTLANLRAGECLMALDQDERAIPFLTRAAATSIDGRRELGKALKKVGRLQESRQALESVAEARPDDDSVHMLLGQVCRALGDNAAAERQFQLQRELLAKRRDAAQKRLSGARPK